MFEEQLKIKDEVDLKELENFGFKDERYRYIYEAYQIIHFYRSGKKRIRKKYTQKDSISIFKETREIRVNYDVRDDREMYGISGNIDELNVLYDLIKAGLVEKGE